jgi:hypothetical protein
MYDSSMLSLPMARNPRYRGRLSDVKVMYEAYSSEVGPFRPLELRGVPWAHPIILLYQRLASTAIVCDIEE